MYVAQFLIIYKWTVVTGIHFLVLSTSNVWVFVLVERENGRFAVSCHLSQTNRWATRRSKTCQIAHHELVRAQTISFWSFSWSSINFLYLYLWCWTIEKESKEMFVDSGLLSRDMKPESLASEGESLRHAHSLKRARLFIFTNGQSLTVTSNFYKIGRWT